MKFLPIGDFDVVTGALNFDTPDCHVSGGCDLYTTKAAGSDKKLYKTIDRSLEAQHAALLKLGASLSPPQREEMAASLNLSRSSPFGPMSEISSRRTFAYLIATLNASHPDYDFSHVLRPADFRRERNLRRVMINIDTTLGNARPHAAAAAAALLDGSLPRGSWGSAGRPSPAAAFSTTGPVWGPTAWAMLDKEMTLKDCTVFSYQPAESPFDEEEGAIWALHYLFFNKALKRVAYIYVCGQPVMSHSPNLRPFPRRRRRSGAAGLRGIDEDEDGMVLPGAIGSGGAGGGAGGTGVGGGSGGGGGGGGASKRARFWLGDRSPDRVAVSDDEEMSFDDGMLWNRDADGGIDYYQRFAPDEAFDDYDDDGMMIDEDELEDEEEDEEDEEEEGIALQKTKSHSPVRGVSEDIASRMEI